MHDAVGHRALDFIETVNEVREPEVILDLFGEMVSEFGFDFFIITGLPDTGQQFEKEVLLNGWPDGWFDHYVASEYFHQDPIAYECFVNTQPFTWQDVNCDPRRWPVGRRMINEASEFGMHNGMCVPIFGLHGLQSAVSLAGQKLDLSPRARAAVHIASIYAHGRARELLSEPAPATGPAPPRLSARERECLQWTAAGKSSWDQSDPEAQ